MVVHRAAGIVCGDVEDLMPRASIEFQAVIFVRTPAKSDFTIKVGYRPIIFVHLAQCRVTVRIHSSHSNQRVYCKQRAMEKLRLKNTANMFIR